MDNNNNDNNKGTAPMDNNNNDNNKGTATMIPIWVIFKMGLLLIGMLTWFLSITL
jgi:hypothetical protein